MAATAKPTHSQTRGQLVPATSGYALLTFDEDACEGGLVTRVPVVAWRVEDDVAFPVTPDPTGDTFKQGILTPTGAVVVPFVDQFKDEATWVEYVRDFAKKMN